MCSSWLTWSQRHVGSDRTQVEAPGSGLQPAVPRWDTRRGIATFCSLTWIRASARSVMTGVLSPRLQSTPALKWPGPAGEINTETRICCEAGAGYRWRRSGRRGDRAGGERRPWLKSPPGQRRTHTGRCRTRTGPSRTRRTGQVGRSPTDREGAFPGPARPAGGPIAEEESLRRGCLSLTQDGPCCSLC